jgi:hypothetical protein
MLLGFKPCHTCDVISVVTEFMVDATGVQARSCACDVTSVVTEFMVDATGVQALPYIRFNSMPLGWPLSYRCHHKSCCNTVGTVQMRRQNCD